jgi:hypothetical protein
MKVSDAKRIFSTAYIFAGEIEACQQAKARLDFAAIHIALSFCNWLGAMRAGRGDYDDYCYGEGCYSDGGRAFVCEGCGACATATLVAKFKGIVP